MLLTAAVATRIGTESRDWKGAVADFFTDSLGAAWGCGGTLCYVVKRRPVFRTLPARYYTDPAVFRQEIETFYFNSWICAGRAESIPAPGDYVLREIAGESVIVVRSGSGDLRAYHNVCRHRGMILVNTPQQGQAVIRCPYHSWGYGLDGKLRATPFVGGPSENSHPAIRREELGLYEIRSHVWMDMIFVNLSGIAPDFPVYAGSLIERWREFDQPLHHGGVANYLYADGHVGIVTADQINAWVAEGFNFARPPK